MSRVAGKTHIALLRGINVGGRHKLPMAALTGLFRMSGASDVETYIQSGNVVFRAPAAAAGQIVAAVAAGIVKDFGFDVPVILRSAEQLDSAIRFNPFLNRGVAEDECHIGFLDAAVKPGPIARLDPKRSPGDSFEIIGREIFLHLPNGVARSRLTNAYFDSILGVVSTFRNWRTVLRLAEMSHGGR